MSLEENVEAPRRQQGEVDKKGSERFVLVSVVQVLFKISIHSNVFIAATRAANNYSTVARKLHDLEDRCFREYSLFSRC